MSANRYKSGTMYLYSTPFTSHILCFRGFVFLLLFILQLSQNTKYNRQANKLAHHATPRHILLFHVNVLFLNTLSPTFHKFPVCVRMKYFHLCLDSFCFCFFHAHFSAVSSMLILWLRCVLCWMMISLIWTYVTVSSSTDCILTFCFHTLRPQFCQCRDLTDFK